ncbi:MAG: SDR family NAD(P)-dependent oxidoreductase [Rhizobiaceae bacterium]
METPFNLFDLTGKVACVTGASSGLGRRSAEVLHSAGAKVVGVARRADMLDQWAEEAGQGAATVAGDLAHRDDIAGIAQQVAACFGSPDILVNAAGINTREKADEVTAEGWNITLDLNLAAPFFLAQAMVPEMRKSGWGRIINFASLQSYRAFSGGLSYGASKGGIAQLTRAMAEAWSSDGITANAVAPGFMRTELTAPVFSDKSLSNRNASQTCIGRNGELSDIDGPILFFSSNASAYVTGQILSVDGGFTAK